MLTQVPSTYLAGTYLNDQRACLELDQATGGVQPQLLKEVYNRLALAILQIRALPLQAPVQLLHRYLMYNLKRLEPCAHESPRRYIQAIK